MTLRKTIFWLHLGSGLTAGLIVAIMSATGATIAFESELLGWVDRDVRTVSVLDNAKPLSFDQLDSAVKQQRPNLKVTNRVVPRDPDQAYEFRAGREGLVYVNPYTGTVAEPKSKGAHDVLHVFEDWHRWLGREGEGRATGRLITGIANIAFLFLCVTGVYMWWPRSWSPKAWRPAVWFVGRLKGRARDFNWHNVFGCWSAIILLVIVTSGVVMSFGWANRLVFALAGEEPPQRGAGVPPGPPIKVPSPEVGQQLLTRDVVLKKVAEQFPSWKSIAFDSGQQPKDASVIRPLSVVVVEPALFQARGRTQLSIDPYRGDVLQKLGFADRSPGARARVWLRFLHTGEAFGLTGKLVATIATLGSLFLVYTGFALAYRRFFPSRSAALGSVSRALNDSIREAQG
jgi:uncharacterized iron-regulated membrane protein